MKGVEQPPQFHPEGDVWIHTRMMLEKLQPNCSPTLAWGVLLHDVGKPPTFAPATGPGTRIRFDGHVEVGARMAEHICRALRFSNDETEQIETLVANHLRFKDVPQMRTATLKRFVRLPRFEEHLELHRLDCLASHGSLEAYTFVQRFLVETPPKKCIPQSWSQAMISRAWALYRDPDSGKSCWPLRRPNSKDGSMTGKAPCNLRGRSASPEQDRENYLRAGSASP